MSVAVGEFIVLCLGLYFGVGLLFATTFVTFGVSKIDPAARGMPLKARLIVLPGVMLLWPLMGYKWLTQTEPPAV
ncbi:MAG: hypothetical protein AAF950_10140 [Pseudomonadota bacterium]